jgi:hypothetical protein
VIERIGRDVERELGRFGAPAEIGRLVAVWPAAVGEAVARNAWPARVARDGTVHVHTSSSAWAFELTQLEGRLREALGAAAPVRMRFAPGPLPEVSPEGGDGRGRSALAPTAEEQAAAQRLVAGIGNEELREKVQRAAELSLARAAADRRF